MFLNLDPASSRVRNPKGILAFTMIEVLLAIGIFSMVMLAIYASWSAILRGSRSGLTAAAEVQRTRVAVRALEDALGSAIMYADNAKHYWIVADTSGEFATLSFVARLPESFPGSGLFPGQPLRRVTFTVDGQSSLLLQQTPILEAADLAPQPYTIKLAPNISLFKMEFLDMRTREWVPEWESTNQLPRRVRLAMGFGKDPEKTGNATLRVIPIMATPITRIGGGGPANPRAPGGAPPPGTITPPPAP